MALEWMSNRKGASANAAGSGALGELLRGSGLRVTQGRIWVLRIFEESACCIPVEHVYKEMLLRGQEIAVPSLYRIIRELVQADILRGTRLHGGKMAFELLGDRSAPASKLVCRGCNRVEVLAEDEVIVKAREMARRHGFHSVEPVVAIYGICASCAGEQAGSAA